MRQYNGLIGSRRRVARALLALVALVALFVTGCTKLVEEEPTPTPLPTPADANKAIFEAKTGSIIETVKGLGRVAASEEATLYFRQSGRLKQLHVELGQEVKKGDVLAELETGNLEAQVTQARINYEIAQLKLAQAGAKTDNDDAGLKQAASQVAAAEATVAKAEADLARLRGGATSADVQGAEASVAIARTALQKAEAELAKLQEPKSADELAAAKAALDKAEAAVKKAQADYDKIAWRPEAAGSAQALALQQATADYNVALANYNIKSAAAKPEEIASAQRAVDSARANLRSAEARLNQVRGGPAAGDVNALTRAVASAQAALDAARASYDAKLAQVGQKSQNFDVQIAQKQMDLAKLNLDTLEAQAEDARVRAPFDGKVQSTTGREGDQINAYMPVVVLANPVGLIVAVEFNEQDLKKLTLGQEATLALDAFKGQILAGQILTMPSLTGGPQPAATARTVRISFSPPGPVEIGALANVTITTQKKENIILVPNAAVRRFGGRKYVQIIADNGRKREVDVETGITTDLETEIVKGLKEGTQVVSQ